MAELKSNALILNSKFLRSDSIITKKLQYFEDLIAGKRVLKSDCVQCIIIISY